MTSDSELIRFAAALGETMLVSGAETYRVEDTIERILSVGRRRDPETFVTTTGIFVCIKQDDDTPLTVVKRVKGRSTNLEKVTAANALSRDFTEGRITLNEAILRLNGINKIASYKAIKVILGYGVVGGGFAFMLGSSITDSICAFAIGFILGVAMHFFKKNRSEVLFGGFLGGFLIAASAVAFVKSGIGGDINGIIIGAAMPLVPGVAATTAIRDIMEGDYVSGVSRLMEAVLTAVAIAGGAGIALNILGGVGL